MVKLSTYVVVLTIMMQHRRIQEHQEAFESCDMGYGVKDSGHERKRATGRPWRPRAIKNSSSAAVQRNADLGVGKADLGVTKRSKTTWDMKVIHVKYTPYSKYSSAV